MPRDTRLYPDVYCVETGELFILLPNTDTEALRELGPFICVRPDERIEEVIPCAGLNRKPDAYWRGLPGNETRANELMKQARANALHRKP